MPTTPEQVFDVLSDGWDFATWVVGAARIRDVDVAWPEPGSRIHHSVGSWPFLVSDTTEVLECERPELLRLRVRAWPSGEGEVDLHLEPQEEGCEVTMVERAVGGPVSAFPQPLLDPVLHARNVEALLRLDYLVQGRAR